MLTYANSSDNIWSLNVELSRVNALNGLYKVITRIIYVENVQ